MWFDIAMVNTECKPGGGRDPGEYEATEKYSESGISNDPKLQPNEAVC